MRINFIIPSWSYWKEPLRAQPLTQLYLATLLEDKVDIEFTDFRDGKKEIKEADLYLYTIASPDYQEVKEIVKGIKQKYPKAKHIAGGAHTTILPNETKGFDSIVIGRGEESLFQILKDFPNLNKQYSIPITKEEYPFPKRHFLPIDKIVNPNLFKTDNIISTTAQFSFGCPFSCSFCANYIPSKIRRNNLEQISEEIDYLKTNYKINGLSLQDEIVIPLQHKEAEEYLNMLKTKNIKWRGQIRVLKKENYDLLDKAKESGLVELSFGLESVNQNVINLANKKIQVNDVENMIYACKERDIKTRIYLINGLPGETKNIVNETKEFIEKTNPDIVLLSSLQPYPGSPIANNPSKYGIKWITHNYSNFNHLKNRFNNDEDINSIVPFEYEQGLSRKEIYNNLNNLQDFLRSRGANK